MIFHKPLQILHDREVATERLALEVRALAAPVVGGMITSTIHVLILVPVFFVMMKERALRKGQLKTSEQPEEEGVTV